MERIKGSYSRFLSKEILVSDFKILSDTFSSSDSDTCIIIEGMNIIYMSPLKQQSFYGVCQFVSF